MSLSPGARNILNILAEVTHNNTGESVFEDVIVSHSGLPEFEVQNYLKELQSSRLAIAPGEQNRP
jgi:hypothetical protein